MIAWRVCKARYDPWDGTGATLFGGRWHSRGRAVVYAADSYAGAILEVLVHSSQRQFMGPHHAVRLDIPDELAEEAPVPAVPGWDAPDPATARLFGDRWLAETRTAALVVPALPCRPVGKVVVINVAHPDAGRITRSAPFAVLWDDRLI